MAFTTEVLRLKAAATIEIENIALAWQAFTAVSLPKSWTKRIRPDSGRSIASLSYLPLVGVALGLLSAGVFELSLQLFTSRGLSILLALATTALVTAAFHEKGLAALYGKNRAAGMLVVVMLFLVKYQALAITPNKYIPWVLVAGAAFSRFAAGAFILGKQQGSGYFISSALIGMLPFVAFGDIVFLAIIPVLWLLRSLMGAWLMGSYGKHDGHVLDTVQQVCEVGLYLAVIVILRFAWV